jgi:L-asparaginase
MMKKILFISTGGTFNKHYSPETGEIAIDTDASTLTEIANKWRCDFEILTIINKDSLYIDEQDREILLETIKQSPIDDIIVIHGTDTMDLTAQMIAETNLSKRIVFTGAMIPYRVDKVEATANVAMAYGYLQSNPNSGIYISMNGVIGSYTQVVKNKALKRFELM